MPTTILGLLGVLLCALAVTSQVTPQTDQHRFFTETAEESIVGGWSLLRLDTEEVEKICFEVKPDMERAVGIHFNDFIPILYRFQIVAGTNYLVKVYVGEHTCIHAMIHQALPGHGGILTVTEVPQYPKPCSAPLEPF